LAIYARQREEYSKIGHQHNPNGNSGLAVLELDPGSKTVGQNPGERGDCWGNAKQAILRTQSPIQEPLEQRSHRIVISGNRLDKPQNMSIPLRGGRHA